MPLVLYGAGLNEFSSWTDSELIPTLESPDLSFGFPFPAFPVKNLSSQLWQECKSYHNLFVHLL